MSWQASCICMETVAASALPLDNGSHNNSNRAMNFLVSLDMQAAWQNATTMSTGKYHSVYYGLAHNTRHPNSARTHHTGILHCTRTAALSGNSRSIHDRQRISCFPGIRHSHCQYANYLTAQMQKPGKRPGFCESNGAADQAKFCATKSQFTRLARKVSTNLGRALR